MLSDAIRAELETSRSEFHALLDSLPREAWRRRSANRGWTNGQLLFHIALGFFLTVPLVWLMRFFAVLPRGASRAFAAVLDASTPLFHWINGLGPTRFPDVMTFEQLFHYPTRHFEHHRAQIRMD